MHVLDFYALCAEADFVGLAYRKWFRQPGQTMYDADVRLDDAQRAIASRRGLDAA